MTVVHCALASVFVLLVGCANSTAVHLASAGPSGFDGAVYTGQSIERESPIAGAERYRVFQQGATGFVSVQSVRADVEEIALNFCNRKSKSMHAVSERTSVPPHVLGNFPRVELVFQCADRAATPSTASKYTKIAELKKLLDAGALTQQEFEAEKAKLLAAP